MDVTNGWLEHSRFRRMPRMVNDIDLLSHVDVSINVANLAMKKVGMW